MMQASKLIETADQCERRASKAIDALYAKSLRRRAQYLREMAVGLEVLEHDPLYRSIHDRAEDSIAGP